MIGEDLPEDTHSDYVKLIQHYKTNTRYNYKQTEQIVSILTTTSTLCSSAYFKQFSGILLGGSYSRVDKTPRIGGDIDDRSDIDILLLPAEYLGIDLNFIDSTPKLSSRLDGSSSL